MSNPITAAAAGAVLLESIENGVALLVMNRPEKLNSLNNELASALNQAFERIGKNDAVRVVVLTGSGRAFCAGGDLAMIGKGREARDSKQLEPVLRAGMGAVLRMRMMPQPVIAAVNGAAAGGVCGCDAGAVGGGGCCGAEPAGGCEVAGCCCCAVGCWIAERKTAVCSRKIRSKLFKRSIRAPSSSCTNLKS